MIVVGSKALSKYFSLKREHKDVDIIGDSDDIKYLINLLKPKEVKSNPNITTLYSIQNKTNMFDTDNVEILNSDNSISLKKYIKYSQTTEGDKYKVEIAPIEVLFSLKKSHIHFPIKFKKHIEDYSILHSFLGEDMIPEITEINFKETEERIGKLKTPSLNKTTKEFFGQSEGYVQTFFIHDDIHNAMAHYDTPLYERMQKDPNLAKCEKSLWDKFTFEDKCMCVLEEAYVIALERKIIPMLFGGGKWIDSNDAIEWALMRICTTLCSGWFREFATNNYVNIKDMANPFYVEKFLNKYKDGSIKRNQKSYRD